VTNADANIVDVAIAQDGRLSVGVNELTYTVTDTSGNSITTTIFLEVRDTIGPVIFCEPEYMILKVAVTANKTATSVREGPDRFNVTSIDNVDGWRFEDALIESYLDTQFSVVDSPHELYFQTQDAAQNPSNVCIISTSCIAI
jgi:hypothetical protein